MLICVGQPPSAVFAIVQAPPSAQEMPPSPGTTGPLELPPPELVVPLLEPGLPLLEPPPLLPLLEPLPLPLELLLSLASSSGGVVVPLLPPPHATAAAATRPPIVTTENSPVRELKKRFMLRFSRMQKVEFLGQPQVTNARRLVP